MPIIDTKKTKEKQQEQKKMYQNKLRAKLVQLNKHTHRKQYRPYQGIILVLPEMSKNGTQ